MSDKNGRQTGRLVPRCRGRIRRLPGTADRDGRAGHHGEMVLHAKRGGYTPVKIGFTDCHSQLVCHFWDSEDAVDALVKNVLIVLTMNTCVYKNIQTIFYCYNMKGNA